jgi:hypothetical protein
MAILKALLSGLFIMESILHATFSTVVGYLPEGIYGTLAWVDYNNKAGGIGKLRLG